MGNVIPKTDLTTEERIKCAYLHYVRGISQQDLAVAYEVNSGRVAEACTAIALAAVAPKSARRKMEASEAESQNGTS